MNINGYVKKFGNKTFKQWPFNDVDALVLSELSYINLDLLFDEHKEKIVLKDIDVDKLEKEVFYDSADARYNKTMLKYMVKSKRFSHLAIKNAERRFSIKDINQFFAVTIVFPNGDLFVSFRGTDITLIGWKEDFLITYQSTMLAQIQGIEYVEKHIKDCTNNFYLGGHSKGGNIAFYTALHLDEEMEKRLIKAYSFDGPGFREGISHLRNYPYIVDRMVKYRTYNDVIGSFYNNIENYKVCHSTGFFFGGHDPFFWQVSSTKGTFKTAKDISPVAKLYEKRFHKWLDTLTFDDRALAVDAFFELFNKENDTIYDFALNFGSNIAKSKKTLERYSKEEQVRLKAILKSLFKFLNIFANMDEEKKKSNKEEFKKIGMNKKS